MKLFFSSLMILSSLGAFAAGDITGTYKKDIQIMVMSETKESCHESQGHWNEDEEICILDTANEAKIEKTTAGYNLHVITVATNYHTCEFEGPAKLVKNTLTSKVVTEEYDPATDRMVKVTCEVKAVLKNGKLNIGTNQKCQSFCGANAWLEVDELKKVK